MDSEEDSEYNPSASPSSADERSSPQKRRRDPTSVPAVAIPTPKRQKGVFNQQYLHLLNEDISSAASGQANSPPTATTTLPLLDLEPTQLGSVVWTASEKHAFFAALARLGRDDAPGIAARVGSKSALEVRQYLLCLEAADRARRAGSKRRRGVGPLSMPSAAELSAELTAALDGAAEALAQRQDAYEAGLEQKRWGGRWLVTGPLAVVLETRYRGEADQGHSDLPPFVELFPLRNWLRLSDRVFMNSGVEDGNWRAVVEEANERPAIRATALADFYSLTLSITRRLVSAALYVASSRIQMKRAVDPTRHSALVKKNDVWAAAASVGLRENSREFWARAARRLRLDVHDEDKYDMNGDEDDENEAVEDEDDDLSEREDQDMNIDAISQGIVEEEDDEGAISSIEDQQGQQDAYEYEIMTYDAVEAALGFPNSSTNPTSDSPNDPGLTTRSGFNITTDSLPNSDSDSDILSNTSEPNDPDHESPDADLDPSSSSPIDSALLSADLIEALTYGALDQIPTTRTKQSLIQRLKAEQRLWADADTLDAATSAAEEARLWGMLRGDPAKPETESPKPDPGLAIGVGVSGSDKKLGLNDQGENWRDRTEYYSAWELTAERDRLQSYSD